MSSVAWAAGSVSSAQIISIGRPLPALQASSDGKTFLKKRYQLTGVHRSIVHRSCVSSAAAARKTPDQNSHSCQLHKLPDEQCSDCSPYAIVGVLLFCSLRTVTHTPDTRPGQAEIRRHGCGCVTASFCRTRSSCIPVPTSCFAVLCRSIITKSLSLM